VRGVLDGLEVLHRSAVENTSSLETAKGRHQETSRLMRIQLNRQRSSSADRILSVSEDVSSNVPFTEPALIDVPAIVGNEIFDERPMESAAGGKVSQVVKDGGDFLAGDRLLEVFPRIVAVDYTGVFDPCTWVIKIAVRLQSIDQSESIRDIERVKRFFFTR
jgi:hypothetical protein